MAKQNNPVEILIEKIKTDQQLLTEKNEVLEEAKTLKNEIVLRLKEYQKDIAHMWKYMTEEQQSVVEGLGLEYRESGSGRGGVLNPVSQIAFDALMKAKDNKLTNEELYQEYLNSLDPEDEAETYTQFNIKIRQLINSGKVTRKQIDPKKTSRDDMMTLHTEPSQN